MSDSFSLEIVNPEKLFLSLDNVSEVVVPAFEGDMGILKDHISIISFLKPGIVKIFSGNEVKELYIEDGLHMNKKGYEVWTKLVRKSLLKDFNI